MLGIHSGVGHGPGRGLWRGNAHSEDPDGKANHPFTPAEHSNPTGREGGQANKGSNQGLESPGRGDPPTGNYRPKTERHEKPYQRPSEPTQSTAKHPLEVHSHTLTNQAFPFFIFQAARAFSSDLAICFRSTGGSCSTSSSRRRKRESLPFGFLTFSIPNN